MACPSSLGTPSTKLGGGSVEFVAAVQQSVSRWSLRDTKVQKQRRRKQGNAHSNAPGQTVSSVQEEAAAVAVMVVVVVGDAGQCLRLSWLLHLHRNRRHCEGGHELQFCESSPPRGAASAGSRAEELLPARHSWLHASVHSVTHIHHLVLIISS